MHQTGVRVLTPVLETPYQRKRSCEKSHINEVEKKRSLEILEQLECQWD